jgi:hypothetical protein
VAVGCEALLRTDSKRSQGLHERLLLEFYYYVFLTLYRLSAETSATMRLVGSHCCATMKLCFTLVQD